MIIKVVQKAAMITCNFLIKVTDVGLESDLLSPERYS